MIYEDVDPQLLAFIHNPLATLDALPFAGKRLRWRTRMLYQVPVLRRFIRDEQVQWLIWDKLKKGLVQAKKTLPQYIFEDGVPLNESTMHRFTNELRKYFLIGITLVDNEADSAKQLALLDEFIQNNIWARLEYTCNRISENLQLRTEHILSILSNANLWLSYYMSEIYFLMAHGLMVAKFEGRKLHIVPTAKLLRCLKRHWMAEICEYHTNISDILNLRNITPLLKTQHSLSHKEREFLVDYVLDKFLSIHVNYLSPELLQHPQYLYLREIVYFAIYIELHAMLGRHAIHESEMQDCVRPATIKMINAALSERALFLGSLGSYIEYKGDVYVRGGLKFKYGLKKLTKHLLFDKSSPNVGGQNFGNVLGVNFERDYIVSYIRGMNDPRFKVYGEFKPGTKSKVKGYDIDFVLQDIEDDIYYFIQVKYKLSELPTYLSEQCQLFLNENFRNGFVKQLAALRDNLSDASIREKLHANGLSGANVHNSHFVLLHNIPFLNFYELEGIFFYEWNLLRNILHNGRIYIHKAEEVTEEYAFSKPCLHKPDELIDAYFRFPEIGAQLAYQYDIYRRATARFVYDDLEIICKLI